VSEFSKRSCSQNQPAKSRVVFLTRRHTAVQQFFKWLLRIQMMRRPGLSPFP